MSKYKDSKRKNITNIVHDLKKSYSLTFSEKVPIETEPFIIEMARKVKAGAAVQWVVDREGKPGIRFISRGN